MRDALGRDVTLDRPPRRIVSLVPSLTETCYALGMGGRVVGATEYCTFPPDAKEIPRVGGTIAVSAKRVEELMPDLVLASADENRKPQIEAIEQLGIPVFVTFPRTLPEIFDMMEDVGKLLGQATAAVALTGPLRRRAAEIESRHCGARPVRALYLIWRDPWMAVGSGTYIDDLLRRAGGDNAAAGPDAASLQGSARYPQLSDEDLRRLEPKVVLLPSEPFAFTEAHRREVAAALPRARVLLVDGEPINWAGPRIADGLEILASALHES